MEWPEITFKENLIKGFKDIEEEDFVMISDLDEIPNLENLNFSKIKERIIIFKQKMFYYKLNLFMKILFGMEQELVKKYLKSPQWLRNIKEKKYPFWRFDLIFSKKKYSDLFFVDEGGWHFTNLKTPEQLEKKLLNFAHHFEFENSGLKIEDIRKLIDEKRIIYDHNIDQKEYKWSGKKRLKKIDDIFLPKFLTSNKNNYLDWFDKS